MKKVILSLALILLVYAGARLYLSWTRPNSNSVTRVSFEIQRGVSLKQISETLYDKELVRDAWAFQTFVRWKRISQAFQAGEYIIPRNLTFTEIAEILQHGKSSEIKVTIPEGSTIKQIDKILAKKSLIQPGEFEDCTNFCDIGFRISSLEGFLFPSTYFINPKTFSNKKFIQRIYQNFDTQITPLQREIQQSGRTLNEIVIVASMIEREANTPEEMPKISDVIWKRLDEGMQLGIDATTRYELDNWKRPLFTEDFEKDSPYNTRRRRGLPPTAISNPGVNALRAAVRPEETDFYYYLHDRNGKAYFARTLEEHNANKQKYLY